MKKIFILVAIMLLMVLLPMGAEGLDSATLTINTSVQGVYEVGVFETAITSLSAFTGGDTVTKVLAEIDPADTDTKSITPLFLAVRTNQKLGTSITLQVLSLMNGTNEMNYDLVFTGELNGTVATVTSSSASLHTISVSGGNGVRIYNFPFHVDILQAYYVAAVPGSYTTAIVINYETL